MKTSLLLLAALAFASAPAFAAPADETPAPTPATAPLSPLVVPKLDANAVALMAKSARAYAALNQLSQNFTVASSINGNAEPDGSGQGTLMFQRPGSARLEAVVGGEPVITVTDGATLSYLRTSTSYLQVGVNRRAIEKVLGSLPSSVGLPLNYLVAGRNPLTDDKAPVWQSARLISKDGLDGVAVLGPALKDFKPATFNFYFDAQTHLLARFELAAQRPTAATDGAEASISEITTFAPGPPIAADSFRYVPAPGVKRIFLYDPKLAVGTKPFALQGETLGGQTVDLEKYKGRVVLLDFWATWCAPCREEMPNLLAKYRKYHPQGFDIIGISMDDVESETMLRQFVTTNQMSWPQLFDASPIEGPNATTYGVALVPFTLLIGKDGNIAAINPRGEDLEPEILAALAQ